MSLIKRPNSRYWYVQFQIDNKTFVRSTKTADRRIALKVAEKLRTEAHLSILLGDTKTTTLGSALRRFVDSKSGTPNHSNLVSHERTILKVIAGSKPLEEITSSVIEDYIRRRAAAGLKPQTIKHGVNCIVGALKKAKKDGFRTAPLETPTIRIPNKRLRHLSAKEERRLLAELSPAGNTGISDEARRMQQDNYDLVILLLDTGARYGEIAGLQWQQINLTERSIDLWRSKVNNQSVLFMTDRVFRIVSRRFDARRSEYVFTNKTGGPRGYSVIAIRKAFHRAGLHDCTVHTLRHTHATRLIQNGLSVYEVQAVLGHADIKTTMRYAHLEQIAVTSKARDVINNLCPAE